MTEAPRLAMTAIKRVFDGVTVVDGVSLEVRAGEIVCLLGPSGCGKSTTLRIAAGVDQQTSGVVSLNGQVISDDQHHAPPEDRSIGLMFQDFALFRILRWRKMSPLASGPARTAQRWRRNT